MNLLEPEISPGGPSTQYLRLLVPKTIPLMAFGNRDLNFVGVVALMPFLRGSKYPILKDSGPKDH